MLIKDPVPGITATPHEDNLRYFRVRVEGPPETPYAGACAALSSPSPCPFSPVLLRGPARRHRRLGCLPAPPPAGGAFVLELFLPEDYPMCAPVRLFFRAMRPPPAPRGRRAHPSRRRRRPLPSEESALSDKDLPPEH